MTGTFLRITLVPNPTRMRLHARPSLRLPATLALALAALAGGACTDTASRARADSLAAALAMAQAERDSIAGLVGSAAAEKDRAMAAVVEATKFADQVDAELRQVRGLTSRVAVSTTDESGKTQAAEAQKDILDRIRQLRQRLAARQAQVAALLDTLKAMRADSSAAATLLADLNARLSLRDRELVALQEEVRLLRDENVRLATDKAALTDTVKAMDARENRVFYAIGTKDQLLEGGVIAEEGGSRGLLIVKRGKTLVPARTLDEARFTRADRREVLTIPMPRADRSYRIVSRHNPALLEVAKLEKDGSFRGDAIRITDPVAFWAPSRYLIIVEK